jgi:hypothetical protein
MSPGIPFSWSDSWLLLSIWYASDYGRRVSTLTDVIAAGDFINHAIFTPGELQNGLARLTSAGYVEHAGESFAVIGPALDFLRNPKHTRRANLAQLECLNRFLNVANQPPVAAEPEDSAWPYPSLTQTHYDFAISEYLRAVASIRSPARRKPRA